MASESAKATIVATVIGSVATILVAVIGVYPKLQQNADNEVKRSAEITVSVKTEQAIEERAGALEKLVQEQRALEAKLTALAQRSEKLLINRCLVRKAKDKSSAVTYGKGSIADCEGDELAIGGTCEVATSLRGTNSRLILRNDKKPIGFECILSQGGGDSVKASAICCL